MLQKGSGLSNFRASNPKITKSGQRCMMMLQYQGHEKVYGLSWTFGLYEWCFQAVPTIQKWGKNGSHNLPALVNQATIQKWKSRKNAFYTIDGVLPIQDNFHQLKMLFWRTFLKYFDK